jgi:TonB family protein
MKARIVLCAFALVTFSVFCALAQDKGTQANPGQTAEAAQPGTQAGTQAPQVAAQTPKSAVMRIQTGGNVQAARLIHRVDPEYPESAKQAHIGGTVVLHAIIGKDGTTHNLEYVSGPSELTKAAMDAVQQWRYSPTLLNGQPVDFNTEISVVFTLGGKAPPAGEYEARMSPGQPAEGTQATPQVTTPAPAPAQKPTRIRLGGKLAARNLAHQVMPVYPEDAKHAHISGTVVLHVIIAKDGSILSLEVISGPPELTGSTMQAVGQWRYKPVLLNGEPLEVDTTVSVVFTLGG